MKIDINLTVSFSEETQKALQQLLPVFSLNHNAEKTSHKDSVNLPPSNKKEAITRDQFRERVMAFLEKDNDNFMKEERTQQIKDSIKKVTGAEIASTKEIDPKHFDQILTMLENI